PARKRTLGLRVESLEERAVPATAGDLDPTFGNAGLALVASAGLGTAFRASDVTVQGDGKVVLAGAATIAGRTQTVVARLSADGKQLDTSFGSQGFFVSPFPSLADRATGVR